MTPYFKTLYTQGQALVEKPNMVMPFSSPWGYVHLARHISPDIIYIQDYLSGPDESLAYHISGWVKHFVIVASNSDTLIDGDDGSIA